MQKKILVTLFIIGGLGALVTAYLVYHFKIMSAVPEVIHSPSSRFGKFIIDKCPIVLQAFSPTFWAGSSLLQTVMPSVFRHRMNQMQYTREIIDCPDGGVISLDWFEGVSSKEIDFKPSPIAMMFPGLIGDSQSEYLRYIVPEVHKLGYRVVAFNNRGRGGMKLKTPRLYCAANFDDIELAIDTVREKNANSLIVASGFSMGGMVLTRYLAERGDKAKVNAALLVSANYDLVNGTKNMETGYVNRYVAKLMTKALVEVILADREVLSKANKLVQWDKLQVATSFRELDGYFTCPMWGYSSPDEYFADSTNNNRLPNIRVPTLALNSADDVFSPHETLPLDKLNEYVTFVVTQRGGHLGFMDGIKPTTPFYGDKLILQYLKAIIELKGMPKDVI